MSYHWPGPPLSSCNVEDLFGVSSCGFFTLPLRHYAHQQILVVTAIMKSIAAKPCLLPSFHIPLLFPATLLCVCLHHRKLVLGQDLAMLSAVIFIFPSCLSSLRGSSSVRFCSKMKATFPTYEVPDAHDGTLKGALCLFVKQRVKHDLCYADMLNINKFQSPKSMKDTHYLFLARIILHLIRPNFRT